MSIELYDVGFSFDSDRWLFRGVSAQLHPGHVYALTGPSGSGKSTLLAMLAGWLLASEGQVLKSPDLRVGWVFQNPHGVPGRATRDHVVLPLLARGLSVSDAETEADGLLQQFGIGELAGRPFRQLSGGEAQRLMLARGIASRPGLLLVDEPTAQLDPHASRNVNVAIAAVATQGTIVVVATHDSRTRDACTDRIDLSDYATLQVEG